CAGRVPSLSEKPGKTALHRRDDHTLASPGNLLLGRAVNTTPLESQERPYGPAAVRAMVGTARQPPALHAAAKRRPRPPRGRLVVSRPRLRPRHPPPLQ